MHHDCHFDRVRLAEAVDNPLTPGMLHKSDRMLSAPATKKQNPPSTSSAFTSSTSSSSAAASDADAAAADAGRGAQHRTQLVTQFIRLKTQARAMFFHVHVFCGSCALAGGFCFVWRLIGREMIESKDENVRERIHTHMRERECGCVRANRAVPSAQAE